MTRVPDQGMTHVPGFKGQGVHAGIKRKRKDVCVIVSDRPCTAAGTFTTNAFCAAPVRVTREHVAGPDLRAIVCNSGNANACTGEQGMRDAREMAAYTAKHLGVEPQQILVASTGIIGRPLDMDKVRAGIDACVAGFADAKGGEAAEAITTTDTQSKEVFVRVEVGDRTFHIGGMAKGAGMIHPNMATMLAFIGTDAPIPAPLLKTTLKKCVDRTFNMITVDGDESTNDMCLVLANGAEGGAPISAGSHEAEAFEEGLHHVCRALARKIARDGEGATILFEVRVEGAATPDDARSAARAVVRSSLVKAAIHGKDPNWGRVVAAVGASDARVDPNRVSLTFEGNDTAVTVMEQGEPAEAAVLKAAGAALQGEEVRIRLHLGMGRFAAEAWGCDLTEGYVTFNSAYTT